MSQPLAFASMPRLTISVPDQVAQPYRFSLDRQVVHFGRGEDNDIVIDSPSVSSEHAAMERIIGGYILTDLGSTNGIKLNGERVRKIQLRNNQNIEIGDVGFTFELNEDELMALRLEDPVSQLPPLDEPESSAKAGKAEETSPVIVLRDEPRAEEQSLLHQPPPQEVVTELPPRQPLPQSRIDPEPYHESEPQPEPQPAPRARPRHKEPAPQFDHGESAASRGLSNKLVAVLAAAAFLAGVVIHFQLKEGSIIEALKYKINGYGGVSSSE